MSARSGEEGVGEGRVGVGVVDLTFPFTFQPHTGILFLVEVESI